MVEEINGIPRCAHVTAERPDGLGERADLNIHATVQVEVVDGAAPVAAEHPGRVRVVNHHDAPVLFGQELFQTLSTFLDFALGHVPELNTSQARGQ